MNCDWQANNNNNNEKIKDSSDRQSTFCCFHFVQTRCAAAVGHALAQGAANLGLSRQSSAMRLRRRRDAAADITLTSVTTVREQQQQQRSLSQPDLLPQISPVCSSGKAVFTLCDMT